MRRKLRALVLAVASAGLLAPGLSTAQASSQAPAYYSGPNYVCNNWGLGYCMTVNSNGTLHSHVKSNSLRWDEELVGTVSSSNSWPFTAGSGLNAKYNGDQVFQLVENEDQSQCAGISYWIGQEATLGVVPCSNGLGRLWVYNDDWLINVNWSNDLGYTLLLTGYDSQSGADWLTDRRGVRFRVNWVFTP
jgi:hypothetical protein